MSALKSTIQISKIAAAQRQLDAAIRMFFQREDELAIHTVAAAAFQILRDVTKGRGGHFTSEVFQSSILSIAQQYVQGTLPPNKKAMIEGSSLMPTIAELAEHIRVQGDNFDKERIHVNVSKRHEHKVWLSETTVFLKHAERDPNGFLSADGLDNEKMLMATCAAYVELMNQPTPEIAAYFAFWSVRNDQVHDLADEVQFFARQLQATEEAQRYEKCAKFIRDSKQTVCPSGPDPTLYRVVGGRRAARSAAIIFAEMNLCYSAVRLCLAHPGNAARREQRPLTVRYC